MAKPNQEPSADYDDVNGLRMLTVLWDKYPGAKVRFVAPGCAGRFIARRAHTTRTGEAGPEELVIALEIEPAAPTEEVSDA